MSAPFIPADQAARETALEKRETLLTVEAGAGTGKTSLLSGRYVRILETNAAGPAETVAITFTEKAAAELKNRIRSSLEEKGLSEAAEELDRAPISTIHAFAASILRERPFEAGIDPDFEQLDEMGSELFLRAAYDRWFAASTSDPEAPAKPLTRALAATLSLDQIRDIAFDLYAHRDLLAAIPAGPGNAGVETVFAEIADEAEALWRLAETKCIDTADEGYRAIEALRRETSAAKNFPMEMKERAILLRLTAPSKGKQEHWSNADACKEQKVRMKALQEKLTRAQEAIRRDIFSGLLAWLSGFVASADAEKRAAGKLDFDDLLFLARDLLRSDLSVRTYFQEKYRYLLIDEFQDTDPIQAEIIWYLSAVPGSEGDWRDLPLAPGKLFVVGDPKQSIYRFRRASIETYAESTGRVAAQGERIVIHQNFRSSPPLIRWVNDVFSEVLGESYHPLSADARHAFTQGKKPVVVLEPAEPPSGGAAAVRRAEAESVARFLRGLLDDADRQVFDRREKKLRAIRPGDIAVLFPTTTDIDIFEEAFRRHDLPFSMEGGRLFYHRTEVHGALAALDAVAHPADAVAVVAALRSILFGLSDEDLLDLVSGGHSLDYRAADPSALPPRTEPAYRILQLLHADHAEVSPSRTLAKLLEKTAAIPLSLTRFQGEQAAANLEKLVLLAKQYEKTASAGLDSFVRWMRERAEESERQSESPLSEDEWDRLRLLTVHKAKGLEFPVVVLANLSVKGDRNETVLADRFAGRVAFGIGSRETRYATANYEEMLEAEKTRKAEEKKRLLYVAATRARDLLVLPRFKPERASDGALWSVLEAGFQRGLPHAETIQAVQSESVAAVRAVEKKPTRPFPNLVKREKEIAAATAARGTLFQKGLPIRSASDLSSHAPDFQAAGGGSGTSFGSALHTVLEKIDLGRPDRDLEMLCAITAVEAGIPDRAEELVKLAREVFRSPVFARIRAAAHVHREIPFSWRENGILYEGVVDLLLEEPDGLVIIDYKTDRIQKEEIEKRALQYAPQIQLYAKAMEAVTRKKVKESLLFFVRLNAAVPVAVGT